MQSVPIAKTGNYFPYGHFGFRMLVANSAHDPTSLRRDPWKLLLPFHAGDIDTVEGRNLQTEGTGQGQDRRLLR